MKKKWKAMWIILGAIVTSAVVVYFFFPAYLLKTTLAMYEWQSGMSKKSIVVNDYKISYYEGGKGEPLVLIHGFGDNKASFLRAVKPLTKHYRVILPAVPGFGQTAHDENRNYSIRSQVLFFDKLFQKLQLTEFHLGGNSMGGHISVAYTLLYPQKVKSLLLLNAAGVSISDGLPYELAKDYIRNEAEFEMSMNMVFYEKPFIPRPVKMHFMRQSAENFDWFNRIRTDIRADKDCVLNDEIHNIKQQTLLLWGDHDQIVSPKIGERFHELMPNSQHVVMEKCGHTPQHERPQETAQILLQFLQNKKSK